MALSVKAQPETRGLPQVPPGPSQKAEPEPLYLRISLPLLAKRWREGPAATKLLTVPWIRSAARQRRRQPIGDSDGVAPLLTLLTVLVAAYGGLSSLIPDFSPVVWGVIGACTAFAGAAFVFTVLRLQRREAQEIEAGRERVRSAERNLEAALRTERIPRTVGIATSGNIVLLPHQTGGENADPGNRSRDEPSEGVEGRPTQHERDVDTADGRTPTAPTRLTLPELWTVTHTRLDLYHEIATGQARRSFRNAQAAMITGFLLLIVFVVVALQASTTAGSVVAGGLGAVSAALSGFVARTFVKSQETAAAHLRAYFDQPLEFSRYLAAERLIADAALTEEQRAEALTALVQAMVTPPAPPVIPGQASGTPGQAGQQ